jgi:hypothetical protein
MLSYSDTGLISSETCLLEEPLPSIPTAFRLSEQSSGASASALEDGESTESSGNHRLIITVEC